MQIKLKMSIAFVMSLIMLTFTDACAFEIEGKVQIARNPLKGATVTLYAASAGAPQQIAQGKTNSDGAFQLNFNQEPSDSVLYLIAKGPNNALALMTLLGMQFPKTVMVNELTTVASTFTAAQFINGESISGNLLGLRIAAGNVPNFVDLETGGWGRVIVDPINSTQTTTLANLNTLGSLISAFATMDNDDWRDRFFKATTPPGGAIPTNTIAAMAGIARASWAEAKTLYALFDEAYPQPKNSSRREAPFVPYLAWTPPDFALSLCFTGGGMR